MWKTNLFVYPSSASYDARQVLHLTQQLGESGLFESSVRMSYPYYINAIDFPSLGFVSMPVHVISLLNGFKYTVVCVFGASLLGIPVLSVLYNTNLQAYKNELLILLIGGGFWPCRVY